MAPLPPPVDPVDGYVFNEAERQQISFGRSIIKVWGTTRNPHEPPQSQSRAAGWA
jgi:hypothetical protein